jgi:negative elongation factor B
MEAELVIIQVLPMLMSFVVDHYTFNTDQKLPAKEKAPVTYPNTLPESFTKFLQEQCMACEVGLYYVPHITKQRNKNAFLHLLPGLMETFGDLAFSVIFLHLLTGSLALLANRFALEDFCSSLFDGFFLTPSPRRRMCSDICCGSPSPCISGWLHPSWRPCRKLWSPWARVGRL